MGDVNLVLNVLFTRERGFWDNNIEALKELQPELRYGLEILQFQLTKVNLMLEQSFVL